MEEMGAADGKDELQEKEPPRAMLFELETVALPGRSVFFDVTKDALAAKEVKLTPPLFARYCLEAVGDAFPANILAEYGKSRVSDAKLIEEIDAAAVEKLTAGSLAPAPAFLEAVRELAERDVRLGALGLYDTKAAEELLEKSGLGEYGVRVVALHGGIRHAFTLDSWIEGARALGVGQTLCVAVASTARSSTSALAAGMSCVAVPDTFTDYQDLGGVDYVAPDGFDADAAAVVAAILRR